jgi:hypothetical protein
MEILNTIEEQNKRILKNLEQNAELMEKVIRKPIPSPQVNIDHKTISELVLNQLGDPAAAIKSEMNNFYRVVREIPKSVNIRGEFYGFTGWKPFTLYLLTLITLASLTTFSWIHNSDNELVKIQNKQIDIFRNRVYEMAKDNPKTAKKYFSELF